MSPRILYTPRGVYAATARALGRPGRRIAPFALPPLGRASEVTLDGMTAHVRPIDLGHPGHPLVAWIVRTGPLPEVVS